jgi:two-component system, OmpR family, phosphate regulon sensor histidine kinase PhoR
VPARRLQEMTRAASEIAAGRMGARAHPGGNDEVADLARSLNRMATELEERLALIDRDRNQLRAMLDGMVEGALLLDAGGRILIANPAFARIFDAAEPLAGRRPLEAARVPGLQEAIEAALGAQEPVVREFSIPGGAERVIQASLAAVREGDRLAGAVAVFHDVTEIKRLERVRREFVANVSHELRTPLTAIKGYAETLLAGGLDDRDRATEFVQVMARHAERLRALIEDLLDLAAVEQREALLHLEPVSLAEVAAQAAAVVRGAAESRELELTIDVPADLPEALADRDRLAQVLINLLDNAVKFTPPRGKVSVHARTDGGGRRGTPGARVVVEVRDTGVGIPPGETGRIFERFYRVERSRHRGDGGTGLGLAIAKHLVLAMNGSIEVVSVPGRGSVFRVALPIAPDDAAVSTSALS